SSRRRHMRFSRDWSSDVCSSDLFHFVFILLNVFRKKSKSIKVRMDSKKGQIVQAALKRFSHYGFNKTTMSEIAVDLNITKANLYYYYPDKNALIKDVLACISDEILTKQYEVLDQYDGSLVKVLCKLLKIKADFLKDYYVLHINENLEWIKGQGIGTLLEKFHYKNIEIVGNLLKRAVEYGEIELCSTEEAATSYTEIIDRK